MSEKSKRKNSELLLTSYDRNWLFVLYRALRLARTRQMHVSLSPKICTERLQNIQDTPKYAHKVEIMDFAVRYEFQMQIWEPRGFSQPDVNGVIMDDGYGQSLVTLRTYPPMLYVSGIILLLLCCYGSWNSPERIVVCGFLFAIFMYFMAIISGQLHSLDHIANQLTQPQPLPSLNQDGLSLKKPRRLRNIQRKF